MNLAPEPGSPTSTYHGSERYFQVVRDSKRAADKWREQLSEDQVRAILEVAARTKPGQMFVDGASVARA